MLISAVSLPAKNAARTSNPPNAVNRSPRDGCSILRRSTPVPSEQIFEDEFHAEIRDRQNPETAQGPAHRRAAAPAKSQPADEQHAEDDPRDQRQHRLLHQVLRE